ncbi:hypothetical protein [Sporosarcina ureae]|uniref:hypothetical protein n=1 Tax=Sporosarcina ureae TaxID=1571 RepID=UPI0026EB6FD0|nr:hypothetical protein [Sporosarcina ureae]
MSKYEHVSNEWLFFFGIIAGYALLGLFLIVPSLLMGIGNVLLLAVAVIIVIIIVLFALAIILKGLTRLFHCRKH